MNLTGHLIADLQDTSSSESSMYDNREISESHDQSNSDNEIWDNDVDDSDSDYRGHADDDSQSLMDLDVSIPENRKLLKGDMISSCMTMIKDKIKPNSNTYNGNIGLDNDAISVIVTIVPENSEHPNQLELQQRIVCKIFLCHFGTEVSDTEFPTKPHASNSKDSIFGTTNNCCQHLMSSECYDAITTDEVLVITSPVKIAIQAECKSKIIQHLNECQPQYYFGAAANSNICIRTQDVTNVPCYGRMIDAILDSCYVPSLNKFVFHVASFGRRHKMDASGDQTCNVQQMFDLIHQMRSTAGIKVELVQMDIAFSLSMKNELVRWFLKPKTEKKCDQQKKKKNQRTPKNVLNGATSNTFCLHSVVVNKNKIAPDSEQAGTIQYKHKKNWQESNCSFIKDHYQLQSTEDDDSHDLEWNRNWTPLMDSYFQSTQITHTTVHNIKAYSTISHMFSKGKTEQPLSRIKMDDFQNWPFRQLQKFTKHIRQTACKTTKYVSEHGICARLEISIRPNIQKNSQELRLSGDLLDVLAHVHVALNDLLYNNHRKLCIELSPIEPVRANVDYLISIIEPSLRLRATESFSSLHKNTKIHDWLKALANLIMVTVGISPEYNLKYLRKWISDTQRYDPTHAASLIMADFHHNTVETVHTNLSQLEVPHSLKKILADVLQSSGISDNGISQVMHLFDLNRSQSNTSATKCFQHLSLADKLVYAEKSQDEIIPAFLSHLCPEEDNDNSLGPDVGHEVYFQRNRGTPESGQLLASSLKLSQGYNHQHRIVHATSQDLSHSSVNIILQQLTDLSQLGDPSEPVFIQRLYYHILQCHDNQICFHGDDPLSILSTTTQSLLNRNASDLRSLKHLCTALNIHVGGPNTRTFYISKICAKYLFPCSHPPDQWSSYKALTASQATTEQINQFANNAYSKSIVVSLPVPNIPYQNKYFRTRDEKNVYITSKHNLVTEDYLAFHVALEDQNLYAVLDSCFMSNTISDGFESRTRLFNHLEGLTVLEDSFIVEDATNNPNFLMAQNLDNLQILKQFMLMPSNGSLSLFLNMVPEIILPATAHMYQMHIFYIDYEAQLTSLHEYVEALDKVISYNYQGTSYTPRIKCHIIGKTGSKYQHMVIDPTHNTFTRHYHPLLIQTTNNHSSYEVYSNFTKHPQGVCKQTRKGQIANSLISLLTSNRIQYQHFMGGNWADTNDPLDLHHYLQEFCIHYHSSPLHDFFDNDILKSWSSNSYLKINDSSSTLADFIGQILALDRKSLCFEILFPLVCIKYKLWLAVWAQENDTKHTHFYMFDPTSSKVTLESHTLFVYKKEQSHILYLKSSISASGNTTTGYWPGEPHNPYTSINTTFSPGMMIASKYSYLDGYLKKDILAKFVDEIGLKIISKDNIIHPIVTPGRKTPTFYLHTVNNEHLLFIYYPFCAEKRTHEFLVIHGMKDDMFHKEIISLHSKLDDGVLNHYSCVQFSSNPKLDFASMISLMLFMYVAHFTDSSQMMCLILVDLYSDIDLIEKTKDWLAHILTNFSSVKKPPAWLVTLCSRHQCHFHSTNVTSFNELISMASGPPNFITVAPPVSGLFKQSGTNKRKTIHQQAIPSQIGQNTCSGFEKIMNSKNLKSLNNHASINKQHINQRHTLFMPNHCNTLYGIKNIGNSCYLASIMQLLFGCKGWINSLYHMHSSFLALPDYQYHTTPLISSVMKMALQLGICGLTDTRYATTLNAHADPTELKSIISNYDSYFSG